MSLTTSSLGRVIDMTFGFRNLGASTVESGASCQFSLFLFQHISLTIYIIKLQVLYTFCELHAIVLMVYKYRIGNKISLKNKIINLLTVIVIYFFVSVISYQDLQF